MVTRLMRAIWDSVPIIEGMSTPTLHDTCDAIILAMIKRCNGNLSEAARRLGIHRTSLMRRVRRTRVPNPTLSGGVQRP